MNAVVTLKKGTTFERTLRLVLLPVKGLENYGRVPSQSFIRLYSFKDLRRESHCESNES